MSAREFVNMTTAHTNTNVRFLGGVVLGYIMLTRLDICGGLRFFRTQLSTETRRAH